MHYIIFGKYQPQTKPLNSNIKLFIWNQKSLVQLFAKKYLQHKPLINLHNQDVFFLEKAKVYKLTPEQHEENGDVIMLDTNVIQNFKYPEMEIHNTNLNAFCEKLEDNNITIQLISFSN
jgi:hypothetical protein